MDLPKWPIPLRQIADGAIHKSSYPATIIFIFLYRVFGKPVLPEDILTCVLQIYSVNPPILLNALVDETAIEPGLRLAHLPR